MAALTTTFLLSLVLAFAAGLVAMAATSIGGPTSPTRAVAVAFGVTLVALVAGFIHRSGNHETLEHQTSEEDGGRGVPILLLMAAIAVSFLITYPRLDEIGKLILGNTGDSGLYIYLFEWQIHAVTEDLGSYFDPSIFAPERFTLFWGPSLIPLVPIYALVRFLTGNIIASFNLIIVATSLATLVATYVFARNAGFGRLSSAVGALLYATTGQRLAHLSHLDSFQTLWIPVLGTLVLKSWDSNSVRHGLFLGVALGFSLLSAPYYFLAGLGMVGLMVAFHLKAWRALPWKSLAAAAGTSLLISAPVLVMSNLAGLRRSFDEVVPTMWADFYHPGFYAPAMRWLASSASAAGGGNGLENWLFPSVVMTLLGALGAWIWLRSRARGRCPLPDGHPKALVPLLAAAAISGLVMSIGPYLTIGAQRIPLPMFAIMKLPGFSSARVTGRFVAPAFLALTVVSLVGLVSISSRLKGLLRSALFLSIAVLILISTYSSYPAAALDVSGRPADVNRELAKRPRGLVVELPWSGCPGLGCLFTEPPRMIWSRFDWFPRLGGYSGHIPDYWVAAQESLAQFPDDRSLEFLRRFGARYVILRTSAGEQGEHFDDDTAAAIAESARGRPEIVEVKKLGPDYLLTLR